MDGPVHVAVVALAACALVWLIVWSVRRERAREVLLHTSWDRTAHGMCEVLQKAESRFAHLGRAPEMSVAGRLVAYGEPSWL